MSSEKGISNCPFCGGLSGLTLRGNALTKRSAEIKCSNCKAEMVVGARHESLEWCEETVITKWNKRANSEHVRREKIQFAIEQLKVMRDNVCRSYTLFNSQYESMEQQIQQLEKQLL